MRNIEAYAIRRLICGFELNGELDRLSGPIRRLADHLTGLEVNARLGAVDAYRMALPDPDAALTALLDVDPEGPPPEAEGKRSAHLGDLVTNQSQSRFVWPSWIVRAHFNLLSSDPKVGKTHLMLDLARRAWLAEAWPDGQPATFPAETPTLWICGDRHQDELRERAAAFGLPPEAVRLNALPEEPYGGWDLDNEENVDRIRDLIEVDRPGFVAIDTVWRATRRRLRCEEEVNAVLTPILTIAQETDTAFIGAMHLSKDGDTLGRRLEGLARAVLKLYRPDPEGQPDRRKLAVIGNFKEPPPLGVTFRDGCCEYDFTPPEAPEQSKGGRPPEKLTKAIAFLTEKLSQGDWKACDLINAWEALGEAKGTIFNAKNAMEADGRLIVDNTAKPQRWHLVTPEVKNGQEPSF